MIELNNKYALDGRDPNSYSGIFWVLGRYDRPWAPERPIFGTVRYMSSANTAKKTSVKKYLRMFGPATASLYLMNRRSTSMTRARMATARHLASASLVAVALVAHAGAQTAPTHEQMHRLHGDPKAYMAALEDPARDAWQKPGEVVSALAIPDGAVIADIGAGSGYFTFRFIPHVGERGRVYAIDINADMIAAISQRMASVRPGVLVPVLARPDDPYLRASSIDLVFICDTWHHIADRQAYAAKLKLGLAPGGRVVIVDFHKRDLPVGPPADMKMTRDEVVNDFKAAGFVLAREHTFLPYQYFLEFTPLD